ncbi:hypothetical protein C1X59_05820 [Pseudomonas sp. FW215-R2]|nr:hypothetical protein C1X59_05820 [Pseudomonas sp. FW215-R2]PMX11897.1 hypothetical protein C1X60_04840 [Pseudomonas sp. FW215-L1]PMX25567.1 hypothetical protein C1X57_03580 [Pseudomonas sp. FW215-E1]PNA32569.1 hypothetical protein C1X58_03060 [Pseudomonas sp. FW215-R4]
MSKWLAKDSDVQALGKMVADRIDSILSKVESAVVHSKLLSFIMTLLRVTLMRKNWGNYTSVIKFTVPSSKKLESVNELPLFYQLPYCVTGMARARSFYLIGLLLGWIDEEQAQNAKQRDDFYLATSASDIWRRVADMSRVHTLLQLFSTDLLGVSTLTGWE